LFMFVARMRKTSKSTSASESVEPKAAGAFPAAR